MEVVMPALSSFGEILDAADALPLERQQELSEILQRRVAEARRREFVVAVQAAEKELDQGHGVAMTPAEFAAELAR
jgi:hypothetical protein